MVSFNSFKEDGKDEKQLLTTFEEKRQLIKVNQRFEKDEEESGNRQDRKKLIKIKNIEKENKRKVDNGKRFVWKTNRQS